MNQVQKISQKILSERLKLQLGLDPDTKIGYRKLQTLSLQLQTRRLQALARAEAAYMSSGNSQPA